MYKSVRGLVYSLPPSPLPPSLIHAYWLQIIQIERAFSKESFYQFHVIEIAHSACIALILFVPLCGLDCTLAIGYSLNNRPFIWPAMLCI